MLIALLALLGVNLAAIVALLVVVLSRKRWVTRQPGVFRSAAREVAGEAHGFHPKWRRGYGRWVHEVLVWTRAPFFFWNELNPVDSMTGERPAGPREIRRLGDEAVVVSLTWGAATVEVAARGEDRDLLTGPYRPSGDTVTVPGAGPAG
jgi:hypothetical protein